MSNESCQRKVLRLCPQSLIPSPQELEEIQGVRTWLHETPSPTVIILMESEAAPDSGGVFYDGCRCCPIADVGSVRLE